MIGLLSFLVECFFKWNVFMMLYLFASAHDGALTIFLPVDDDAPFPHVLKHIKSFCLTFENSYPSPFDGFKIYANLTRHKFWHSKSMQPSPDIKTKRNYGSSRKGGTPKQVEFSGWKARNQETQKTKKAKVTNFNPQKIHLRHSTSGETKARIFNLRNST